MNCWGRSLAHKSINFRPGDTIIDQDCYVSILLERRGPVGHRTWLSHCIGSFDGVICLDSVSLYEASLRRLIRRGSLTHLSMIEAA